MTGGGGGQVKGGEVRGGEGRGGEWRGGNSGKARLSFTKSYNAWLW